MNKKWLKTLIALALLLAVAIPVAAITFGEQDFGEHPYVGLIGFYDADGEWMWRCSGTLLSPQLVLTAGHCTGVDLELGAPAQARVWFDEEIIYDPVIDDYTNPVFYDGVPVPHPAWDGLLHIPETHDIGVVVLDEPVEGIDEFGQLPPLGVMDEVGAKSDKRQVILTSVGYGVNDLKPEPRALSYRTRWQAQSFLIHLYNTYTDGWNIMSSNNPGQWVGSESEDVTTGGTCFGDSGGPVFLGLSDSDLVVGIVSFGNSGCAGADFSYRVDIQDSYDFLGQFIELP